MDSFPPPPCTAVLLAGGKSTRLGRDKAGVLLDNRPLWQRQLATLRAVQPRELFISGKPDGPYARAGVEILADNFPGLGPLAGLEAALRRASHPLVLVLAIDLPAMTAEFLCSLVKAGASGAQGCVPRAGEWFEPLAAVYPRACQPLAVECLRAPDRSMQRFVRLAAEQGFVRTRELQPGERALFRNINVPGDLEIVYADARNYGPRFEEARRRFDEENGCDPNVVNADGVEQPYELLYAKWVTDWVRRLCPQPSEALLLAARCQHICRWMIPRKTQPMTRAGYLKWRADLKQFHAQKSAEILRETGYAEDVVARVRELNLKRNLAGDPECQVLEDALCLVTLQHQLADLIDKTEPDKMVGILQKTWRKMSPAARTEALAMSFSERETALLQRALACGEPG